MSSDGYSEELDDSDSSNVSVNDYEDAQAEAFNTNLDIPLPTVFSSDSGSGDESSDDSGNFTSSSDDDSEGDDAKAGNEPEDILHEVENDQFDVIAEDEISNGIDVTSSSKKPQGKKKISYTGIRKEAVSIMKTMDDEFCNDLAIHLYMVHMLDTQNNFVGNKEFTAWPLPKDQIPIPTGSLQYCDELNPVLTQAEIKEKQKGLVQYSSLGNDSKDRPENYMLEFTKTLTDPVNELSFELQAAFQRAIHEKVNEVNEENLVNENKEIDFDEYYEPIIDPPIQMPPQVKNELFSKINELIDHLIIQRTNNLEDTPDLATMIDWSTIAQLCEKSRHRIKLESLFSINYPKEKYPIYDARASKRFNRTLEIHNRRKVYTREVMKAYRLSIARKKAMLKKRRHLVEREDNFLQVKTPTRRVFQTQKMGDIAQKKLESKILEEFKNDPEKIKEWEEFKASIGE